MTVNYEQMHDCKKRKRVRIKKHEKRFQGDFKQGTIYDQIGCVAI